MRKQTLTLVVLGLLVLVGVALMATPVSAAVGDVQLVVENKTQGKIVEVHLSQGCFNFGDGTQRDVPAGQVQNIDFRSNQTANITLHDPRPGMVEIFVGCIAAHASATRAPFTLTIVEDATGDIKAYHNRGDGWLKPKLEPQFDPEFGALVAKYTPACPALTQARFNTLFNGLPQANFNRKFALVPRATLSATLGIK